MRRPIMIYQYTVNARNPASTSDDAAAVAGHERDCVTSNLTYMTIISVVACHCYMRT